MGEVPISFWERLEELGPKMEQAMEEKKWVNLSMFGEEWGIICYSSCLCKSWRSRRPCGLGWSFYCSGVDHNASNA